MISWTDNPKEHQTLKENQRKKKENIIEAEGGDNYKKKWVIMHVKYNEKTNKYPLSMSIWVSVMTSGTISVSGEEEDQCIGLGNERELGQQRM